MLDVTTTELADEHVGGFLSAGPDRLTAAGKAGIPQVVSTGALDMVNFYAPESVPPEFKDRSVLPPQRRGHADADDAEENAAIGAEHRARSFRRRRARSRSCCRQRGVRRSTETGQPFDDPAARKALHEAIRAGLKG